jgi:hypothetical protein
MIDGAARLRKQFIDDYARLQAKREHLPQRVHAEGKALLGEETQARKFGWRLFDASGKYTKDPK